MLDFICFGSGSSGNSYLLTDGKDSILIDAGIGIRTMKKYMMNYGVNTSIIRGILITHDHADHIGSAGRLSNFLKVKVFVSGKVFDKMMKTHHRFRLDFNTMTILEPDNTFSIGGFSITPFRIPHDASDNFGYYITHGDEVFTLMTDIGCPTDEVCWHIRNSNYLVIEADYDPYMLEINPRYDRLLKERISGGNGHLSNEQTAQLIFDNYHEKLKFVSLCHLSQENNKPELAKQTVLSRLHEKDVHENESFRLEVLKRNSVSGPFTLKLN